MHFIKIEASHEQLDVHMVFPIVFEEKIMAVYGATNDLRADKKRFSSLVSRTMTIIDGRNSQQIPARLCGTQVAPKLSAPWNKKIMSFFFYTIPVDFMESFNKRTIPRYLIYFNEVFNSAPDTSKHCLVCFRV